MEAATDACVTGWRAAGMVRYIVKARIEGGSYVSRAISCYELRSHGSAKA
jgi:hypothetical protein